MPRHFKTGLPLVFHNRPCPRTSSISSFGDNLVRLRGEGVDKPIPDEVADLIYLDPPFNSQRQYSALFKQHKGQDSPAQIMAFEDTWTYSGLIHAEFKNDTRNAKLFGLIDSLHKILGDSDMMAYVLMMAPRLLELHKQLKPTGSLYLHCDPVASHYLKIILDVVFGPENFRNEVIWKRTGAHGGAKRWGPVHDVILFYTRSSQYKWRKVRQTYDESYLTNFYRFNDDKGRYRLVTLTGAGTRTGDSGKPWKGVDPTGSGRHWAVPLEILREVAGDEAVGLPTQDKLDLLDTAGCIYWPTKGAIPQFKKYLDEDGGNPVQDIVTDILPIAAHAKERRGYPTQKPLALLERVIAASTDEGDVVLDPFAGCGTAIVAAERMNRKWIGIDVTYLAINEIVNRLKTEKHHDRPLKYELLGTPKDEVAAKALFRNT